MQDIAARITETVIDLLKQEIVPWRKPWATRIGNLSIVSDENAPRSFATRKAYLGINSMMLSALMLKKGYKSPYFLTFKQVQLLAAKTRVLRSRPALSVSRLYLQATTKRLLAAMYSNARPHVMKGEKGTQIVFWQRNTKTVEDKATGEEKEKSFVTLQYYTVFNVEQCAHVKEPKRRAQKDETTLKDFTGSLFSESELAEQVLAAFPNPAPVLVHGGNKAAYYQLLDRITLPFKEQFESSSAYYSTRFHELAHSTGHETRLKRESLLEFAEWGDETYSREELVAEMSAAMLMSFCNLSTEEGMKQSASYLSGWLEVLKNDSQAILVAAGQAQKVVEFMLSSFKREDADDELLEELVEA